MPARQPGSPNPALGPYPTLSVSPVPSTPPQAASTKDDAGAVAFLRYYVRLYNASRVHPSKGAMVGHSLPSCGVCAGFEATVEQLARERAHYVEPTATITEISASVTDDSAVVALELSESPGILVDRWGGVIRWYDGDEATYRVNLTWQNGWKIKEITRVNA